MFEMLMSYVRLGDLLSGTLPRALRYHGECHVVSC